MRMDYRHPFYPAYYAWLLLCARMLMKKDDHTKLMQYDACGNKIEFPVFWGM